MDETAADKPLNDVLRDAGLEPLDAETEGRFVTYLSLIIRWNEKLNLTSLRTKNAILSRHLAESIVCARSLSLDITTLLDFGSGAGLPGIPIALCRPEISVTLAESQGKKAAFLREVVRTLGLFTKVHAGRAEDLRGMFDCVTLRAVDKMPKAIAAATKLVKPGGWLVLMTTSNDLDSFCAFSGVEFMWNSPVPLPGGERKMIAMGRRRHSEA